jgi:hypothetical protein
MKIKMKRGELFQLAKNSVRMSPAKREHTEAVRRAVEAIQQANDPLAKAHRAEYEERVKALKEPTEEAKKAIADELANLPVEIEIDTRCAKAYVAACMAVWGYENQLRPGQGMPYEVTVSIVEDLKALGVWDAWGISAKVLVEDKELDTLFPSEAIDDTSDLDNLGPTQEGTSDP